MQGFIWWSLERRVPSVSHSEDSGKAQYSLRGRESKGYYDAEQRQKTKEMEQLKLAV